MVSNIFHRTDRLKHIEPSIWIHFGGSFRQWIPMVICSLQKTPLEAWTIHWCYFARASETAPDDQMIEHPSNLRFTYQVTAQKRQNMLFIYIYIYVYINLCSVVSYSSSFDKKWTEVSSPAPRRWRRRKRWCWLLRCQHFVGKTWEHPVLSWDAYRISIRYSREVRWFLTCVHRIWTIFQI